MHMSRNKQSGGSHHSREQQGVSSGHFLVAEQAVAARTEEAPMRRVAPMGRMNRDDTMLTMLTMLRWKETCR